MIPRSTLKTINLEAKKIMFYNNIEDKTKPFTPI